MNKVNELWATSTYQKKRHRSEGQGPIMSKVRIGEEGTQQGYYACDAVENVNECCSCQDFHVEDCGQINHEVS
jgi:hypothetical protein